MKYCTALAALFAAVSAEDQNPGAIFNGCYTDPNHPQGWRWISFTDQYYYIGKGTVQGSDTGPTQEWTLPAVAEQGDAAPEISVDFSPKGGPADFPGTWSAEKGGIAWSDGNFWPRTSDD